MLRKQCFFLALIVPIASSAGAGATTPRGMCAAPMPSGFDWPADPTELYKISGGFKSAGQNIAGKIDIAAQRRHGWLLFAGVTQPSDTTPDAFPIFHTWYTVEEAFDTTDGRVSCQDRDPLLRLSASTQFIIAQNNPVVEALRRDGFSVSARFDPDPGLVSSGSGTPMADAHPSVAVFSHVAFNAEMYDYIRNNKYFRKSTLDALVDPQVIRKPVADPPLRAISLKFAWWPASPDALTPLPVWDFDPRFPGDAKNPPTTWKRVVVVDAKGGQTSPQSVTLGGFKHDNPTVVGLDRFYSVQVSQEEADLANGDFRLKRAAEEVLGRPLKKGDYLLLTALHIATREFDPWVFTTYWWTDKPNVGPLAADMPKEVSGVWRNFVMDVSYNINEPKTPDGKAPISYSPWLELFQAGGTRSQCMACHARAAHGANVRASFNPTDMSTTDPNGFEGSPISDDDPAYKPGTVSLHRIWTIFTRTRGQ